MKKIMTMALCLILVLSLEACGTKVSENGAPVPNVYEKNKSYTYNVAFANWTEDSKIISGALNTEKMIISSVQHLPVYKLDSKKELDSFKNEFKDVLTMDKGLDETPSFDCITAAYDDNFFSKYSLMLAYVQASSGSYRYGVSDIFCDGKSFCMYIEQLNHPEVYDAMMSGWFAVVEVDKKDIDGCIDFDAQLVLAPDGSSIIVADHIREELCEQGFIDRDNLYWKDGLFFSIKTNEEAD